MDRKARPLMYKSRAITTVALLMLSAGIVSSSPRFKEFFETPDASGGAIVISPRVLANWAGANVGFRSGEEALLNENRLDGSPWVTGTEVWSTPEGEQAALVSSGNNQAIMTLQGVVGVWEANTEYILTFRTGSIETDGVIPPATYNVRIYAINTNVFDDAQRNNFDFNTLGGSGGTPGYTTLANSSGAITTNDMSEVVTIPFNTDTNIAYAGQDIAFAFVQTAGTGFLIDDVLFEVPPPAGTLIILK